MDICSTEWGEKDDKEECTAEGDTIGKYIYKI